MVKLFVGGLGEDNHITNEDLRPLFEQYGVVTECECMRNKSYAFVHMEEDSQADAAIQNLNGHWIKGRSIKVHRGKSFQKVQKLGIGGNIYTTVTDTTNERTMASEAVRER